MASPMVLLSDKRRVLGQVMEGRGLRSVTLFIDLLLRKKRLRELQIILVEFEALVEHKHGIKRAQVVSAVPLTDDELKRLHAELERNTGAKIRLTTALDPDLIGGALVRIGDRVVDRTVKTLLEKIGQQLMEASV
jgi:F-type H+-transporting ATPase subunit delta